MIRNVLAWSWPPLFIQTVLCLYPLSPPSFQHDHCVVDVVGLPY